MFPQSWGTRKYTFIASVEALHPTHCIASNFINVTTFCKTNALLFITFDFAFYSQAYYLLYPGIPLLSLGNSFPPSSVLLLSLNPFFIYSLFLSRSIYIPLSFLNTLLFYFICFLTFTALSHQCPPWYLSFYYIICSRDWQERWKKEEQGREIWGKKNKTMGWMIMPKIEMMIIL